jgi:hypothetical protein
VMRTARLKGARRRRSLACRRRVLRCTCHESGVRARTRVLRASSRRADRTWCAFLVFLAVDSRCRAQTDAVSRFRTLSSICDRHAGHAEEPTFATMRTRLPIWLVKVPRNGCRDAYAQGAANASRNSQPRASHPAKRPIKSDEPSSLRSLERLVRKASSSRTTLTANAVSGAQDVVLSRPLEN